jgi:hypothetical protein
LPLSQWDTRGRGRAAPSAPGYRYGPGRCGLWHGSGSEGSLRSWGP